MIPYGYCHCGCGEKTSIPISSHPAKGYVKGVPVRYRPGHHQRPDTPRWTVEDRGYISAATVPA